MKRVCAMMLCTALLMVSGAVATRMTVESAEEMHWAESEYPRAGEDANNRFPLYVELPDDDIQLYGIRGDNFQGGMVLFQEGCETYCSNWGYAKYDYPQLAYHDFYGDHEKEIAVITLLGSGTGFLLTDLHLLTVEKVETGGWDSNKNCPSFKYEYVAHSLTSEEAARIINQKLSGKFGEQSNTIELSLGKERLTVDIEDMPWIENSNATVGQHIRFAFEDNGFRIHSGVSIVAAAPYITDITADATFNGKEFGLTNLAFAPYEEAEA